MQIICSSSDKEFSATWNIVTYSRLHDNFIINQYLNILHSFDDDFLFADASGTRRQEIGGKALQELYKEQQKTSSAKEIAKYKALLHRKIKYLDS